MAFSSTEQIKLPNANGRNTGQFECLLLTTEFQKIQLVQFQSKYQNIISGC